ncbi:MAG: DNA repair protein RadC [Saprospiraceae bacterium]|uniref:DNA repair protein RadC n=1 Tax=Candidatus Defluviibacterium haderslevense TaxID=2981993 RepID=A0A9D7S6M2_9BACT|nr:DNA repair protein RadC [Candidatus Defluviibacterium haderslevense]
MNNNTTKENQSIKSWAEDDRPREKLLLKGKDSLSNSELLAILLRSGSKDESALSLAKRILESCNNNLFELSKIGMDHFKKFKGVGKVKAITILAALEIGKRRQQSEALHRPTIQGSRDAYEMVKYNLEELQHEESWAMFLNRRNAILGIEKMSAGGISGTIMDMRMIYKRAIEHQASGIILVHNHPSGNLKPSSADMDITSKAKSAGTALDIQLLDHLIISEHGYYSFADEGVL